MPKEIVVYSVMIGAYDNYTPLDKNIMEPDLIDYFYITDNKTAKVEGYQMVYVDIIDNDNLKTSRYYKLKMCDFLKKYKYSIYYDGNVQVINQLSKLIPYVAHADMAQFDYFVPFNVKCHFLTHYFGISQNKKKMFEKYAEYKSQGWHDNKINPTGKFIIRKYTSEMDAFLNDWYNDTVEMRRDEFTLHFNLWKHKIKFNMISSLFIFQYFNINWHKTSAGKHNEGFNKIISPDKGKLINRLLNYKIIYVSLYTLQWLIFTFFTFFYTLFRF